MKQVNGWKKIILRRYWFLDKKINVNVNNNGKVFVETEDYGTILRSKGMVEGTDGKWIYFDMVSGEYEIRDGEPDYTGRLVVIGTDIDEHKLEELFGL